MTDAEPGPAAGYSRGERIGAALGLVALGLVTLVFLDVLTGGRLTGGRPCADCGDSSE